MRPHYLCGSYKWWNTLSHWLSFPQLRETRGRWEHAEVVIDQNPSLKKSALRIASRFCLITKISIDLLGMVNTEYITWRIGRIGDAHHHQLSAWYFLNWKTESSVLKTQNPGTKLQRSEDSLILICHHRSKILGLLAVSFVCLACYIVVCVHSQVLFRIAI